MGKGTYGIANLLVTDARQVTLFCSWGNDFDRVSNHEDANKLFKMIEKQCPTVIDLFLGKSGFGYINLPHENNIGGVSKRVNLDRVLQVYELVGEPSVIGAVIDEVTDIREAIHIRKTTNFESIPIATVKDRLDRLLNESIAHLHGDFRKFKNGLSEQAEFYNEKYGEFPAWYKSGYSVDYVYDLSGFFEAFPFINASKFAKEIGMNESVMRKYKGKIVTASDKQRAIIQSRYNDILKRMEAVRF